MHALAERLYCEVKVVNQQHVVSLLRYLCEAAMMRTHLAVVCVCFLRIILAQDIPLGCGGFLKSNFDVDFTRVKVSCHVL